MERYHKEVYFPQEKVKDLEILTKELNGMKWKFSSHCLANLKYRAVDQEKLLKHISILELNKNWIFEYYVTEGEIIKLCYRVPYEGYDFILVLNNQKKIVTIYMNSKTDNHETLRKEIYNQK